jgi:hypothetical protein
MTPSIRRLSRRRRSGSREPQVGELATEQTEMWVFFDDRNVYVSARMHDSAPDRMVADEMRRDASLYQNEHFVVVLDTFPRSAHGILLSDQSAWRGPRRIHPGREHRQL